jgi:hypothetical protein
MVKTMPVDSAKGNWMLDEVYIFGFGFVIERYLSKDASHITTRLGTYAHTLFLSNSWAEKVGEFFEHLWDSFSGG